jgi:hypothetical protein
MCSTLMGLSHLPYWHCSTSGEVIVKERQTKLTLQLGHEGWTGSTRRPLTSRLSTPPDTLSHFRLIDIMLVPSARKRKLVIVDHLSVGSRLSEDEEGR